MQRVVQDGEIDEYQHVNNAVYVTWLDRAAWKHAAGLGMPLERCLALDRGMVVLRTVLSYRRPALRGDRVDIATWIIRADGRLRVSRRFQVRRREDGETLMRAEIDYVCTQLSTGRPVRMPVEFTTGFGVLAEVEGKVAGLEPL